MLPAMRRRVAVMLMGVLALLAIAAPTGAQGDDLALVRELLASHWRLAELDRAPVGAEAAPTLTFIASGGVSGSGGCNDWSGSWTWLGDTGIDIADISVTREPCDEAVGRVEQRFLDLLILTTSFAVADDGLTLTTGDGADLVFQATSATGSALVGEWVVTAIGDQPAADIPRSSVTFDDTGTLSGSGGCNELHGAWSVEGDSISIEPLAVTRGTCAEHVMAQETPFLDLLGAASAWALDGDTLHLLTWRSDLVLTRVSPVTYGLTDTPWSIRSITEPATASSASTVLFDSDGTVSGFGGCNDFRGPWRLDDDGIVLHIGPLMATRTRCDWGDGPDREAVYLATLEDVIGYKTPDGSALWLNTASGVRITFDPPATPSLTGATWYLAEVNGNPFAELAPVNISFSPAGTLFGNGGCDLFSGSVEVRGDAIRMFDITTGERDCDQSIEEFQGSFLGLLPLLDRMAFDAGDLLLYVGDQPALRFETR